MGDGVGRIDADEDYTPLVPQVRIRVGVECASVQDFVASYCRYVDGDRIFVATEALEAPGSLVQFRVDLANGRAALHGTGTVIEARGLDGGPRGMLLRFVALDEASARVVEAMAARRARSTPSAGVPTLASAQQWHTQSIERDVVPANPFGDVPDAAIVYFVDWSIERANGTALRRGPAAVAYHEVRMQAPRRRRARLPAWLPFVVGLVTGSIAIVAVIHAYEELGRALAPVASAPVAQLPRTTPVAPSRTTPVAAPTRPSPVAAAPDTSPVAASARTSPVAASPTTAAAAPASHPASGPADAPLALASSPPATVLLDGTRVGRTPLTLRVAAGAHVVELVRPRYQTARIDVDAPGSASLRLERPRATVHVTANVAGAEVFVDDEPAGVAPVSAEVAGYERVTVEVRAGDRRWRKRVYVRPPLTDLAATFAE